jgi:DNA-binding transcriptional MocR family regulator
LAVPPAAPVPPGARDLASGNPDPALLPDLSKVLGGDHQTVLYGAPAELAALLKRAGAAFAADGIPADHLAVVNGGLDGVERVLLARVRPNDAVAVEDPGYPGVHDVVAAIGARLLPVAVDDWGMVEASLSAALDKGAAAVVLTPRAQNPTGAALDADRVAALRRALHPYPDVLVVEDDHAGAAAGTPALTLAAPRNAWAVVRSVAKTLGPDLRLAVLAGDATTVARVRGRQRVGPGWVSHILQQAVVDLWSARGAAAHAERAGKDYARRRDALVRALARHGIAARGRSGLNVWVPVGDEGVATSALLAAGYAVAAGARFRLRSAPAIRITTATMTPRDVHAVADALADALRPTAATRLT